MLVKKNLMGFIDVDSGGYIANPKRIVIKTDNIANSDLINH